MKNKIIYFAVIAIAVLVVISCVTYVTLSMLETANNVSQSTKTKDTVLLAKGVAGQQDHFTDANGMTLYHYLKDFSIAGKKHPYSECDGDCSITWPPFYAENIIISAPLQAGDFTIFTRDDGRKQMAWRGWPMYYYSGDHKAGDTNGQNIDDVWYMGILIK